MKVGILTYHHVANWGSVLQAYCLQRLLERLYPNAVVEIIDYVPETSATYNEEKSRPNSAGFLDRIRGKRSFHGLKHEACSAFLKSACRLSTDSACTDDIGQGRELILSQNYDAVVVGSDTVLQFGPNFGGTYISAPQAPNLYFLPFDAPFKKIVFAGSANPFHSCQLESLDCAAAKHWLSKFATVTYRDSATADALRMLGLRDDKLHFMPDPTFLHDFTHLAERKPQTHGSEKLGAVAIGDAKLAGSCMSVLANAGYTPVNLLSGNAAPHGGINAHPASVSEYLGQFRTFETLVTDRFHGAIIGMQLGCCPIIAIEQAERYPEKNSKVRDLFARLGLEHMLLHVVGSELNQQQKKDVLQDGWPERLSLLDRIESFRHSAFQTLRSLESWDIVST